MTMSHRQHIALRELKEMREAELREIRERESRERAERERPLKEAEAALRENAAALGRLTREKIATQQDDEAFMSPELANTRMTTADARKFNKEHFESFVRNNPGLYLSSANIDALDGYFERNHLRIIDEKMIKAAWDRMSTYGLLAEAPAPEPHPTPEPQAAPAPIPEPEPKPEVYEGWNPDTGERKTYTRWDVDRMTGDEYRRAFRIYKDALRLPRRPAF